MLKWMKLRNLALVSEAEIEFSESFNVISGETGAGKSVIMGALSLLLGERADKSAIRNGCQKCELAAEFHIPDYAAESIGKLLSESEIDVNQDDSSTLLVRRVITPLSGRNFVNNSNVSLAFLKSLGALLIDVHAANENQSLLKTSGQLAALDRYADAAKLIAETESAWKNYQNAIDEKMRFLSSMPSESETEQLRKDVKLIESVNPYLNEDEELKSKHFSASNAVSIINTALGAANALTDVEDSLFDRAATVRRMFYDLEKTDPENGERFASAMENISQSISELSAELSTFASDIELDEASFAALEERMRQIQSLKRKFGPSIEDVLAHLEEIKLAVDAYENAENIRADLENAEKQSFSLYSKSAASLSLLRQESANKLVPKLEKETKKLGFANADFGIVFSRGADGPSGFDRIEFMFSANPGVEKRPLRSVASSGEISRVLLALKTVLADADAIPILVFDEIDANIGGETASKVASELAELGRHKQIISISHLAQTATCADRHFLVYKTASESETVSSIVELEGESRVTELGRMLGGDTEAHNHARAILKKRGIVS